jgi:hypothetical protein
MRKLIHSLLVLGFSVALSTPSFATQTTSGAHTQGIPMWVQDALTGVPSAEKSPADTDGFGETFSCLLYDGTYCSTNGGQFRCMWDSYNPGFCYCADNTWHCA